MRVKWFSGGSQGLIKEGERRKNNRVWLDADRHPSFAIQFLEVTEAIEKILDLEENRTKDWSDREEKQLIHMIHPYDTKRIMMKKCIHIWNGFVQYLYTFLSNFCPLIVTSYILPIQLYAYLAILKVIIIFYIASFTFVTNTYFLIYDAYSFLSSVYLCCRNSVNF